MARVRGSCRGRKTRSRLSRSNSTRRNHVKRTVYSRGKRGSSRVERNSPAEFVPRELSFADVDGTSTPIQCTGRRRSDRILRRSSLQKSSVMLTPTASGLIDGTETSYANRSPSSTLEQIQLVPGDDNKIVESMFGEVFDKVSLLKVEVEQCVSLQELRVRPLHQFGIQRAIHLLRGKSIGSVTGHICVGKFPVVAELPGEYYERILEYFCEKGRDREASKRFIDSKTIYQVVNGGYEHEGRWRLIDSSAYQFTGIKWRTVEIPWQHRKVLRAISMMSSQVQKRELVVDLSFLDEMVHLRRVVDEYIAENAIALQPGKPLPRGFCKEICKAYCGGKDYSNNTLRHLVSIAAKLSLRTTLMIRHIIDEECPAIAKTLQRKNTCEDSVDLTDTRVFRTLINSKSLRGAKDFFADETSDEDRQNALQRLRFIAQENQSYKGVDPTTLDTQVAAAIAGRKAIEGFRLRILRNDEWPAAVKPLLRNILWTTKLDSEINENRSKPDDLLGVLRQKYLECAGVEGGNRVEQYEKFVLDRARKLSENAENREEPTANEPCSSFAAAMAEEETRCERDPDLLLVAEEQDELGISRTQGSGDLVKSGSENLHGMQKDHNSMDSESEPEPELKLDPLRQCDIEVHGLTWEDYNRTVLTEQEIFDLVISDPFQKAAAAQAPVFEEDYRSRFVQFIRKVLVPGGYVFVIVPQLEVSAWLDAFDEFELRSEGIFTLVKDPESVQRVKGKSFQQNLVEVAAVARKPGRHPTRFVMDVLSPYTQLPRNRYKRRAPVIDNVYSPSNRLCFPRSKTQVRTGEKSPSLLWELMKTFCPPGGKVLDPVTGTLTTGIAGIQSGRPCVLLESDKQCLALAEARLRAIAVKKLKEVDEGHILLELGTQEDVSEVILPVERAEATSDDARANSPSSRSFSEECDGSGAVTDTLEDTTHDKGTFNTQEDINAGKNCRCHSGAGLVVGHEKECANKPSGHDSDERRCELTPFSNTNSSFEAHAVEEKKSHSENGERKAPHQRNEDLLKTALKTPKIVTRKRKRRTQVADDDAPTSSRPRRERRKNIRYA